MFKKRPASIELTAETPKHPVKVAGADLPANGNPVPFTLTQRVEVERVAISREGKQLTVALGTDDGHFINIVIKD